MSDIATHMKVKKSRKYGDSFSVMRFNSNSRPLKKLANQLSQHKVKKPTSSSPLQFQSTCMFASNKLPDIPEPPSYLKEIIDALRIESAHSNAAKKKRIPKKQGAKNAPDRIYQKKTKTKLNAFMAYRAFYSRDIFSTQNQRKLSGSLSKAWAEEKGQLVWKRYATEYNVHAEKFPNVPFVEWLMKTTGKETDQEKENRTWTQNAKSGLRVQDIYFNDNGELVRSNELPNAFERSVKNCDSFIRDFDFDSAIMSGNVAYLIDPSIENLQNHSNSNY